MKSKKVILIIVLAMVLSLVFAACQTDDTDKIQGGENTPGGETDTDGKDEIGGETDDDEATGGETDDDEEVTDGESDTQEPEPTPEEPKTIEIDYQEYMQSVLTALEQEEDLVCNDISTWSTDRQDALKEYLDTNYGEQFMTGDTVLDRMTDKSIVGYDFDFDNNTLTALVQATSSVNTINYRQRSIKINSVYDFVREYLTNNDIKQKYGDLTNSYEDEAGNKTVFVKDGQEVDFSATAIIEGKYTNSSFFATIKLNQSSNYAPSEYEAVKDVYNFIFGDEQYEQIDALLFATEGSTYGLTIVLGKEGYTFSSTMLYYNTDGQLTTTRMFVETPSNGARKFTDISKDGVYMQDYAIRSNETKVFGNGQTIVRVVCLESENPSEN